MPPKKPKPSPVYLTVANDVVDSAHATQEAASARATEIKEEKKDVVLRVDSRQLQGGIIVVGEDPRGKSAAAAAPKKAVKEEAPAEANTAAKKTKTPAEQRAANAAKPKKPSNDEELPENVKDLLEKMGNALEGKAIVVTGIPPTLGRKNAEKLVVNYGGKLTKSLSKNTTLVLVGNDAGPTKLDKIEELSIETVDEDGFIALLEANGGGGSKRTADDGEKPKAKKAKK